MDNRNPPSAAAAAKMTAAERELLRRGQRVLAARMERLWREPASAERQRRIEALALEMEDRRRRLYGRENEKAAG